MKIDDIISFKNIILEMDHLDLLTRILSLQNESETVVPLKAVLEMISSGKTLIDTPEDFKLLETNESEVQDENNIEIDEVTLKELMVLMIESSPHYKYTSYEDKKELFNKFCMRIKTSRLNAAPLIESTFKDKIESIYENQINSFTKNVLDITYCNETNLFECYISLISYSVLLDNSPIFHFLSNYGIEEIKEKKFVLGQQLYFSVKNNNLDIIYTLIKMGATTNFSFADF